MKLYLNISNCHDKTAMETFFMTRLHQQSWAMCILGLRKSVSSIMEQLFAFVLALDNKHLHAPLYHQMSPQTLWTNMTPPNPNLLRCFFSPPSAIFLPTLLFGKIILPLHSLLEKSKGVHRGGEGERATDCSYCLRMRLAAS